MLLLEPTGVLNPKIFDAEGSLESFPPPEADVPDSAPDEASPAPDESPEPESYLAGTGIRFLPEGTVHAGIIKRYRIDGRDEYMIEYRQQTDGSFKIYAPLAPSDPHGNGPQVHHRYGSGEICVKGGHEPRDVDRAVAIASLWMKRYSQYVRTGVFDNSGGRVDV